VKQTISLILIAFCFSLYSCEKKDPNAVDLSVDFTWEGIKPCLWGNPEIRIRDVTEDTSVLVVSMYDHVYFYDHGKVTIAYDGSGIIKMGALEELQGPCPPDVPGRYEITVKALDGNDIIVGIGSKERYFPEKK